MSNPYLPQSPSSSTSAFPFNAASNSSSFPYTNNNPYSPQQYSNSYLGSSSQSNSKADPNAPITRSRTLFYLSIRDSSTTSYSYTSRNRKGHGGTQYGDTVDVDVGEDEEEQVGLIGSSGAGAGHGRDSGGLPPKWVDISDEVEDILSRAKIKIAALDKLHAKHVLPGFTDRSAEEREIERQTSDITRDFKRCSSLISSVRPGQKAQRVEVVTAKNVQRGLAQKVQDLSGQFRKKQRVYMQKLQGHAIKNKDLMVASGAMTLKGTDLLDELQEDEQASRSQLQSQTQSQAQGTVALDIDIQQRSNEITQIASSISELADLFRDLGNMIVEQGTVLDSVEYNVQVTARELSGAVEELKVAQQYQANTGRRKCILFLVLCILGLILILIYKPRSESSPSPSSPSSSDSESTSSLYDEYPIDSNTLFDSPTYAVTESATATSSARLRTSHRPHLNMPKPPPLPEDW